MLFKINNYKRRQEDYIMERVAKFLKEAETYYLATVEICAFKNGEWLRVAGELVEDDRREVRQSMLDAYPSLQNMYSADDGNTEVFYFKNATATFSSFTNEPEVVKF